MDLIDQAIVVNGFFFMLLFLMGKYREDGSAGKQKAHPGRKLIPSQPPSQLIREQLDLTRFINTLPKQRVVLTILLLQLALIGLQLLWGQNRFRQVERLYIHYADQTLTLSGVLTSDNETNFPGGVTIDLTSAQVTQQGPVDAVKFCVSSFTFGYVYSNEPGDYVGTGLYRFYDLEKINYEPGQELCLAENSLPFQWNLSMPILSRNLANYYPFEKIYLSPQVSFKGAWYNRANIAVAPIQELARLSLYSQVKGYSLHSPLGPTIVMERPQLIRVLTPLLILLLVTLTSSLPFFSSPSSIGEVAIGLSLGVWAIRDTLVPEDAPNFIAIDRILLCAYAYVAIAAVSALVLNLWRASRGETKPDANN